MSVTFLYCPREPMLIPCEPSQTRFWTTMSVLFGLKETQSTMIKSIVKYTIEIGREGKPSVLSMIESWMTIRSDLYVSQPSEFAILTPFSA